MMMSAMGDFSGQMFQMPMSMSVPFPMHVNSMGMTMNPFHVQQMSAQQMSYHPLGPNGPFPCMPYQYPLQVQNSVNGDQSTYIRMNGNMSGNISGNNFPPYRSVPAHHTQFEKDGTNKMFYPMPMAESMHPHSNGYPFPFPFSFPNGGLDEDPKQQKHHLATGLNPMTHEDPNPSQFHNHGEIQEGKPNQA